ncbi:MAG: class I SAM-dependent methyltransferase [Alphaproteobacteria bacterium]|nr:class I SAM-dependent methyltransferase [Alphaproteobacteria bacterium]
MLFPIEGFLRRVVVRGSLSVIDADGGVHRYAGREPGRTLTLRFHTRRLPWRLLAAPDLAFGEGYMDGSLTVENGDIADAVGFLFENIHRSGDHWTRRWSHRLARLVRRLQQYNPAARAKRNVAHHYDLSADLYRLFLDQDMQYSCAYFREPDESLDAAQRNKKLHIAAKLLLDRPGLKVLDIGSGWGGLAIELARLAGADVTGVTLSEEQLKVATQRAMEASLAPRVQFRLQDYRAVQGQFDRIVSVGMFEHVGINHYPQFFATCRRLLAEDGVGLLHTIGRSDGPAHTNTWIRKYIFPGGYSPALSEIVPVMERAGLYITDIEVLRYHYAETLQAWRRRFLANRAQAVALYDERFARMWEFYLAASEAAFRYSNHVVFHIQFSRRKDAVPACRDYIGHTERRRDERRESGRQSRHDDAA